MFAGNAATISTLNAVMVRIQTQKDADKKRYGSMFEKMAKMEAKEDKAAAALAAIAAAAAPVPVAAAATVALVY